MTSPQIKQAGDSAKEDVLWHHQDISEILEQLDTNEEGIDQDEVEDRKKQYGVNSLGKTKTKGVIYRTIEQIRSPLAFILVLAFLATLALGEYIDAGVIFLALFIAVVVGVLQEGKASRAFKTLADSQVKTAVVKREGQKHEIKAEELVVGDVVILKSGMQVPADIRLYKTKNLSINEATLTGEWMPVSKNPDVLPKGAPVSDRKNLAYKGTSVVDGFGEGVVVAVGKNTMVGDIADDLSNIEDVETPLQEEMKKVSMVMLYIIMALVSIIFILGVAGGQSLKEMLLLSIAISVASVPEGLPAAVTIILAVGMETLLKRGGLVRNLLAAETMGSTTYILTDKTGTLTKAKMVLSDIVGFTDKNSETFEITVLDNALAATSAYSDQTTEGVTFRGEPIERAILERAQEMGISESGDSLRGRRLDFLAFSSENRFSASLAEDSEGDTTISINGAPELLLEKADYIYKGGEKEKLTKKHKQELEEYINEATRDGKRLIATAYCKKAKCKDIPDETKDLDEISQGSLVFLALLYFDDPVREDVGEAISGVKKAGARVKLVTGDNPNTALAVALETGIAKEGDEVVVGTDVENLSDNELLETIDRVSVFARILPKQKMRLASLLQKRGEIVAMTGDGTNDAPALRKANIGVAVGTGTEVSKEASDLILVNNSFSIMYAAIEEGRRIISNLRKIVGYLLSTSLSEVVLISAAIITGAPAPLVPAQILWANVIEEGLMSFAFAFEKGDRNAMKRSPQDVHEKGILSGQMLWFVGFVIAVLGAISLSLYFYLRYLNVPLEELRSVMFLLVAVDSLFMAFAFRSLHKPIWQIPLTTNLFFLGSFTVTVALLAGALAIPFMQTLLSYQPLPLYDIMLVIVFALGKLATIEVGKWLFFKENV